MTARTLVPLAIAAALLASPALAHGQAPTGPDPALRSRYGRLY